jgi:S-DNA-T family DNA segregation ATPase FtsK/SpoIIIE
VVGYNSGNEGSIFHRVAPRDPRASEGLLMAKAVAKQGKGNKAGPKSSSKARVSTKNAEPPSWYRQRLGRLMREAVLFAAAAVTVFLLAALVSYSPRDPGWSGLGDGTAIENLFGAPGAWFADVLLSLFGYLGFIFPWLVLYGGWLVFANSERSTGDAFSKSVRAAALLLWLVSGCGLAWLALGDQTQIMPQGSGGILGAASAGALAAVINTIGAAWFLITVFVITLSVGLGFSWLVVTERTGHFVLMLVHDGFTGVIDRFQAWRANRAERKAARSERAAVPRHEKKREKKRVAPTLGNGDSTSSAPVASAPADAKSGVRVKKPKKTLKANQLDLPIEEQIDVPTYDPERDSPLPPTALLDPARESKRDSHDEAVLQHMSEMLEQHLADFNVQAKVVAVEPGPVITRFELEPAPGVKVSQISNLSKDLARAMSTTRVRVVEVIPGKSVVGLEIPNAQREMIALREILESSRYTGLNSPLTIALGKDIGGNPVTADLGKMPHLLVAGTTGSGKSVAVNAMILSILHKATAEQVRLIMIDPKMLELSVYEGIPHLLAPVVTDMKDAANALRWCVGEMERRYKLMSALGVRNVGGYNIKVRKAIEAGTPIEDPILKNAQSNDQAAAGEPVPTLEPMPAIVIVVDELADMMMVVGKKVEELIARIAQKARAAGLHMILATQRPSVDVITGLIKANIPTRIGFQVASKIDSRTILDQQGAESLLGHGDMLYLPPGTGFSTRVHGAFVDDHEVHKVVEYLKQVGEPNYIEEILDGGAGGEGGVDDEEEAEADPLYDQAVAIVTKTRKASISYVQRRLRVGYNRSARLIEQMENAGIVSAAEGSGGREVLAPPPPED